MTGGSDLNCLVAGVPEHRTEVLGVIPARPQAENAEKVTDPLSGVRAEVDGQEASRGPEHAVGLPQPSTL